MKANAIKLCVLISSVAFLASCSKHAGSPAAAGKDPDKAEVVSVDRFSATAGHLQVRTANNGLPAANVPVNFDQGPFITRGLTPDGKAVDYYNFDVQSVTPAPIWAFFKADGSAVAGQLNIINVLPGEGGYNDFWQVYKVTVPAGYVANTVTSYSDLVAKGYTITKTDALVNCPVVPKGSTASKRLTAEDPGLTRGWYKDKVVYYFNFSEKALTAVNDKVPLAPIYVTFNINPGMTNGGPESGFMAENGTTPPQTHNVIATTPAGQGYSPLWAVNVYDNSAFASVHDYTTAAAAPLLAPAGTDGGVNCPVVYIKP